MSFRDLVYETLSSLTANKMRSFLTILGIIIGISSVILMLALVSGFERLVFDSLGGAQANTLTVYGPAIKAEDVAPMVDSVEGVEQVEVLSYVFTPEQVSYQGKVSQQQGGIQAVSPAYKAFQDIKLRSGRWFSQSESSTNARVAVVGRGLMEEFVGVDGSIVGGKLDVNGEEYLIVGVLDSTRMSMDHNSLYVPQTTAKYRIGGTEQSSTVFVRVTPGLDVETMKESVRGFIAQKTRTTNPDEIYIESMDQMLQQIKTVMLALSALLGSIAGISLLVGGIGIMNMMLTNVTERIREIGLRKALGASRGTITRQFLTEAIVLCVMGGLMGILFGWLGSELAAWLIRTFLPDVGAFCPLVTTWSVVLSVSVSMLIGIVFGWYPARRAAKLDPIEALRFQ